MEISMVSFLRQRSQAARPIALTTGQIITCDVDVALDDPTNRFRPNITYRYTVNDQEYTGTRLCAATAGSEPPALNRRQVESLVRSFSDGQSVTVYYNPADPQDAYLIETSDRGGPLVRWLGLLLGLR